jgi:hypothetical protein
MATHAAASKPAEPAPSQRTTSQSLYEAKFCGYLRQNAKPTFLTLLRSVDQRVLIEIGSMAKQFVKEKRPPADIEQSMAALEKRGKTLKAKIPTTVDSLLTAAAQYREIVSIAGLLGPDTPVSGDGIPSIPLMLEAEAVRLIRFREEDVKRVYNKKRFGGCGGIFGNAWLVLMQEFFAAWTERSLGAPRLLQPVEMKILIEAAKAALGWNLNRSPTVAEDLSKAISHFRSNKATTIYCRSIKTRAVQICSRIQLSSYLLGIEI